MHLDIQSSAPALRFDCGDADSELEGRIANYLFTRTRPTLRRVSIQAENGCVRISGQVPTFYEKQLCINSCQRVAGVVRLIDEVEVTGRDASA